MRELDEHAPSRRRADSLEAVRRPVHEGKARSFLDASEMILDDASAPLEAALVARACTLAEAPRSVPSIRLGAMCGSRLEARGPSDAFTKPGLSPKRRIGMALAISANGRDVTGAAVMPDRQRREP
jgi:hypothetical protein